MPQHKQTFPYIQIGSHTRPIIPISVQHGGRGVDTFVLVDSGADITILNGELTYILDIDLSNLKTHAFSGVKTGEEGTAYPYMVDIGIDDTFFRIPVLFSFDLSFEWGMGILGQVGFFDKFIIEFDRSNKLLHLK